MLRHAGQRVETAEVIDEGAVGKEKGLAVARPGNVRRPMRDLELLGANGLCTFLCQSDADDFHGKKGELEVIVIGGRGRVRRVGRAADWIEGEDELATEILDGVDGRCSSTRHSHPQAERSLPLSVRIGATDC